MKSTLINIPESLNTFWIVHLYLELEQNVAAQSSCFSLPQLCSPGNHGLGNWNSRIRRCNLTNANTILSRILHTSRARLENDVSERAVKVRGQFIY